MCKVDRDSEVAMRLADAYMRGYGFEKDYMKAYQLYCLPILDSNENALLARCKCLEKGLGVEKNIEIAMEGYKSLAKKNMVAASRYNYLKQLYF